MLLVVGLSFGSWSASAHASQEDETELLRTDSKAPYVHRITIYDHDGVVIDPEDDFAGPYSPRMTCAKCHPYAEIADGWHFSAPDAGVPAGRPGEPWLLVDESTGTVLPISGRGWPGTFKPEDVGLSHWDFVMKFGHHIPGGGYGEPSDEVVKNSDKSLRWHVSGKLEIDCMFCHAADQRHDPAEAERQIESENFRWAPTAALGLAMIRCEARKAPDDWDPMMPPDPDYPEKSGPRLLWDLNRFDPDDRTLVTITRRPPVDRCYFCHSFREVGEDATDPLAAAKDVHLVAGMTCVDCHRNGMDHQIIRGYRSEAAERGDASVGAYSCEGCHLGVTWMPADASVSLGGHYGAPRPEHKGLPPHHSERLTCTTCHSGPWPEMYPKRFQTALAHGLGLTSREREDDDPPHIVGPVFAHQHDGKIAPQRMVWPAFWTKFHLGRFTPIPLVDVRKAMQQGAPARSNADAPQPDLLTAEELTEVLGVLRRKSRDARTPPLYLRDGSMHALTPEGKLETSAYFRGWREANASFGAYLWSIAHNVRPASQSLGVRGCTDCHSNDAPIHFGRITDAGDAHADAKPIRFMHQLRGDDATFARAWNLGFVVRPVFKWFGFICAGIVALIALHYVLNGVGAVTRRFR